MGYNIGTSNKMAVLDESDVISIRERFWSDEPIKSIADDYGVTYNNVGSIVRGETWKHVDGPTCVKYKPSIHDLDKIGNHVHIIHRGYMEGHVYEYENTHIIMSYDNHINIEKYKEIKNGQNSY